MAKVGRPKRKFTEQEMQQIEQMALDNCHLDTIALAIGIPKSTLDQRLRTFIEQKRAQGRAELARQQKERCAKGDTTMLIWRGKQDLKQSDKQEHKLSGDIKLMPPKVS